MSWDRSTRRWATGALAVVALLAGGCGSGAVDGPGEDDDAASDQTDNAGGGSGNDDSGDSGNGGNGGNGGGDNGGGGDTDRDRYSWDLPVGDITPDDAYILYQSLREGCDAAAGEVAEGGSDQYNNLSDEQKQTYNAAIAVCRGDVELGRTHFAGAGHGGSRSMCFIYAGVVSVLEQRPPDTSGCPPNPGEGTTSTESTSTTEGESTTSTGDGETTSTEATGVGDGGG